jgi:hypothetical protein
MKETESLTKDLFPDLNDTDENKLNADSPLDGSNA